ncbi:hexosaminidase [Kibdelosporangium banguiense]|uniref:beta-N-acetylhexosaminidase n=1 Tax=Kibdelosporangium banguiense TaxID=1365924 RepID=A0ABS4TX61_9PSEU|nr:family 20 glycosylhydrolase [Kibdelosporangium banguiense]MBP2328990.1 hexosaminidase [Kibdelosporangium banguiense]
MTMIPTPVCTSPDGNEFDLAATRSLSVGDAALVPLAETFRATLRHLTGIELPAPTMEAAVSARPALRIESGATEAALPPPTGRRADDGDPRCEFSVLEIGEHGIRVRAEHPEGLHRGLTSIVQHAGIGSGRVPCGRICDAPRFAWRGLSVDVARTFVPVAELKRVVDMLSLYKMNVLHLHLTDNEGWRLEIESWPRLTEAGARGIHPGHYTKDEFRAIVAYARERFVTVVPEIDFPGHVGAVLAAHPELGQEAPDSDMPMPTGHLAADSELVWRFVRDVLTEVADITEGAYIHIGGDEAFAMTDDDHARFVSRAVRLVRGLGKKVIGWQETVRGDVGPDEIIQHWIDFASQAAATAVAGLADEAAFYVTMFAKAAADLPKAAAKGTGVLLSPTAHAYLDRPHGDPSADPDQETRRSRLGMQRYPATSLEAFANWEPLAAAPEIEPPAIVGVEAALWCETVRNMADLEQLLLPRLPGVAEAAWAQPGRFTWPEHRDRLALQARMWQRATWRWYQANSVDWPAGS